MCPRGGGVFPVLYERSIAQLLAEHRFLVQSAVVARIACKWVVLITHITVRSGIYKRLHLAHDLVEDAWGYRVLGRGPYLPLPEFLGQAGRSDLERLTQGVLSLKRSRLEWFRREELLFIDRALVVSVQITARLDELGPLLRLEVQL